MNINNNNYIKDSPNKMQAKHSHLSTKLKLGYLPNSGVCLNLGSGVKNTIFGDHKGQNNESFLKVTPLIWAIECQNNKS